MNIEDFRNYCLSFKGVHDKLAFTNAKSDYDRNLLAFYVLEKWFCLVNIDYFDFCNLKCDKDEIGELQALYDDIQPAYHMNKRHWIKVYFNRQLGDDKIKELVARSYNLVVGSMSKKEKERLNAI